MPEETSYIDSFEAYRTHQLSAPATLAFEAQLTTSADLRQAYDLYLTMVEGVKQHKRDALKKKLQEWDDELSPE